MQGRKYGVSPVFSRNFRAGRTNQLAQALAFPALRKRREGQGTRRVADARAMVAAQKMNLLVVMFSLSFSFCLVASCSLTG
jgi:hypothetical protein